MVQGSGESSGLQAREIQHLKTDTPQTVTAFLSGLERVLGSPSTPIALHEPEFRGNELSYLKECIDSGWVSYAGRYVEEFEQRLEETLSARHVVALVNGTAALHVALLIAGVEQGDEVLVPALCFVATANAVTHCGAIPHFVDSDSVTLGIASSHLQAYLDDVAERSGSGLRNKQTGRRIAAVIPMHTFGHAVEMDTLMEVASRNGLMVIEDAAESLGSTYKGQHLGNFGLMGVLSFNGNKIVTTGGGGAIVTNDPVIAARARHLTSTAKVPHRWEFFHDEVGYNFRLPSLNAALGCAQLEQLPGFIARKRELARRYAAAFEDADVFQFVREPPDCESNYWLNAVRLAQPDLAVRNAMLDAAVSAGFQCRPAWTLLPKLPMYRNCPRAEIPVAEALEASLINIPSSPRLAN
jgi:perosamine synthetase